MTCITLYIGIFGGLGGATEPVGYIISSVALSIILSVLGAATMGVFAKPNKRFPFLFEAHSTKVLDTGSTLS
jgi:hypothetical protein